MLLAFFRHRPRHFGATILLGCLVMAFVFLVGLRSGFTRPDPTKSVAAAASSPSSSPPALVAPSAEPAPVLSPPTPGRRVYVGVYLADISGFDLKEGRFKADLLLWCKWLGDKDPPSIVFANGEIDKQDEIGRETEGDWRTVRWRVQGTFRGNFPLHSYPFDRQQIRLQIDLPEREGLLVPDLAGSGMASEFSITGWLYDPFFQAEAFPTRYASDFGSIASEGRPAQMSSVAFAVQLQKPFSSYVIKVMIPLAIIILMAVLAFFVPAHELEVRAGICVTALLSAVAFHLAQADNIPEVPYLTTADKVFLGTYLLILTALALCVINYNVHMQERPRLATWLDRAVYIVIPLAAYAIGWSSIREASRAAAGQPHVLVSSPPAPAHATTRTVLTVGVGAMSSLNAGGILRHLLRRGLAHQISETRQDPYLAAQLPSLTNGLVRFLPDGGMIVSWRLRRDLRWGDGAPIGADDIAFSFALQKDVTRRAVQIVDPWTVEVNYGDRKYANLEPIAVYPKHALETLFAAKEWDGVWERLRTAPPPLDGPYLVDHFTPNHEAVLRRNPHFAGDVPALEQIRFVVITEASPDVTARMVREHSVDLLANSNLRTFEMVQDIPGVTATASLSHSLFLLHPDVTQPPFQDVRVRQAALHAINRAKVGRTIFGLTQEIIATSYRPAATPDHATNVKDYPYNPAMAKQLLKEAGLGRGVPVRLHMRKYAPDAPIAIAAEGIRQDLNAVGFHVEIEMTSKSVNELITKGTHGGLAFTDLEIGADLVGRFWNLPTEPDSDQLAMNAPVRLFDDDMVSTYQRFRTSLFDERRTALSRHMQQRWAESLPVLPLVYDVMQSIRPASLVGWEEPEKKSTFWWNVEHWYFQ